MKITQEIIKNFDNFIENLSADEFKSIVDNSRFDLSFIVEEKDITCLDDIFITQEHSIHELLNIIKNIEKSNQSSYLFNFHWNDKECQLSLDHFYGNETQYNTDAVNDSHYELVA